VGEKKVDARRLDSEVMSRLIARIKPRQKHHTVGFAEALTGGKVVKQD